MLPYFSKHNTPNHQSFLQKQFKNFQNIRLELTTPVDDLISGAKPHYHVHFPFQHVLPKLTRARFNGVIYCSGPPEPCEYKKPRSKRTIHRHFRHFLVLPGRAITNMWSKAMLYTNSVVPTPERTSSTTTTTTTTTTASPKNKNEEEEQTHSPLIDVRISSECGQSNDVQPLVVNGQSTAEGEFPWLVALMYRKGFNYEFRCTANLVSDRHIITGEECCVKHIYGNPWGFRRPWWTWRFSCTFPLLVSFLVFLIFVNM